MADHIAIVYKGRLVCEGPGTSLKARFGDDYIIRSDSDVAGNSLVWRTSNSAQATRKLLELESLMTEDHTYNVVFPTLEQVFLKVTSDSNTAIHDSGGDGIVGEEEAINVIDEKISALEQEHAREIELEVGHSTDVIRQIVTLFSKRYILLTQKSSWIAYGINLVIPIIIAAALVKFLHRFDSLQTCAVNEQLLLNATAGQNSEEAGYPVFAPLQWYELQRHMVDLVKVQLHSLDLNHNSSDRFRMRSIYPSLLPSTIAATEIPVAAGLSSMIP